MHKTIYIFCKYKEDKKIYIKYMAIIIQLPQWEPKVIKPPYA